MKHEPVESSALVAVGYDAETAVLEIVFRSGARYRYYAVPRSVHRALMTADSKGKAFSELIRDRYPTEQLDD